MTYHLVCTDTTLVRLRWLNKNQAPLSNGTPTQVHPWRAGGAEKASLRRKARSHRCGWRVAPEAGPFTCPPSPNSKGARPKPKYSSLYPTVFPPLLKSQKGRSLNTIHLDSGQGYWGEAQGARKAAAKNASLWDQLKCWVLSPDPASAPPVKIHLRLSGREKRAAGGGTWEGGTKSLPAARLAAAGNCRRLQYRRPEAAPRSHTEAAMLPPPRLPAVTSFAPVPTQSASVRGETGKQSTSLGPRTHALCHGVDTHP